MELQLRGVLHNLYKSKDFEDKKTGEVTPGKWKCQFMFQRDLGGTQQAVLEDVSIPDALYPKYKDQVGKEIVLAVGTMAKNNRVILFGV
jgi:hypothetical protein